MSRLSALWVLLTELNIYSVLFRTVLATVLGACIGGNRGRHGRAAGTRTHVLVCLGAAITTMLGFYTAYDLGFSNDPLRVGAQVISGVGFLGAGTIILRNHSRVTGLTTAAGLWTTACIGLAVGAGFYPVALAAFVMVLLTFTLLHRLDRRMRRDSGLFYIEFEDIQLAKQFYAKMYDRISDVNMIPAKSALPNHVGMELFVEDPKQRQLVFDELQGSEYVAIALPHSA